MERTLYPGHFPLIVYILAVFTSPARPSLPGARVAHPLPYTLSNYLVNFLHCTYYRLVYVLMHSLAISHH